MLKVTPISQHLRSLEFSLDTKKLFAKQQEKVALPQIKSSISTSYRDFENDTYEVVVSVVCDSEEENFFRIACDYSGVFKVENYKNEEALDMIVAGYCTGFVFPFIRAKIASITMEAGLQSIMLEPVDFYALHKKQKNESTQEQA